MFNPEIIKSVSREESVNAVAGWKSANFFFPWPIVGQIMDLSNEAWAVVLFLAQGTHAEASNLGNSPWLS